MKDVRNRRSWDDTFVDALCELPETFTFCGMFAHVITFNAYRRMLAIDALRRLGVKAESFGCPSDTSRVWRVQTSECSDCRDPPVARCRGSPSVYSPAFRRRIDLRKVNQARGEIPKFSPDLNHRRFVLRANRNLHSSIFVDHGCAYFEALVLKNLDSSIVADTRHPLSFASPSGMRHTEVRLNLLGLEGCNLVSN